MIEDLKDLKDGMEFNAVIDGFETSGKISIDSDGDIFLCQNDCNGALTENRHGYKYSWWIFKYCSNDPVNFHEHFHKHLKDNFVTSFSIKKSRKSRLDNIV
jgi:hypothetical protein